MNSTIITLTLRTLLGRRRAVFLLLLPAFALALGLAIALATDVSDGTAVNFLSNFVLATVVPLLGVLAGTSVVGPEIEDGSIVYLLAKPLSRYVIVTSKFVVAAGCAGVLGGAASLTIGLAMAGFTDGIAVSFAVAAVVAGVAYSALFLMLGIVTRHAVVIGLVYVLVWESFVGGLVAGARTISVREWAIAVANSLSDYSLDREVGAGVGATLLVLVTVGGVALAGYWLRSLKLSDAE